MKIRKILLSKINRIARYDLHSLGLLVIIVRKWISGAGIMLVPQSLCRSNLSLYSTDFSKKII